MPWQFYLCFASFPRLILIGAKWLKSVGQVFTMRISVSTCCSLAEMRNTTPPITSNHPIQWLRYLTFQSVSFLLFACIYFVTALVLSFVAVFPHYSIECWSHNWGRPRKPSATVHYEEVSVLYLLFLEYPWFAAEIGKTLHLESFLLAAAMCKIFSKTCLNQICWKSELTGGRRRWLDYQGDADSNFLWRDKKVPPRATWGSRHAA